MSDRTIESDLKFLIAVLNWAAKSRQVDWRFHVALVLAHETEHRIGAIRQLRWSDIDLEREVARWRAEHEKTGYEHSTPVTPEASAALMEARGRNPGTGDGPVLPAPTDTSRCAGRTLVRSWWERAQKLAGLEPQRGRGWHSLRRKFASDLMDLPLSGTSDHQSRNPNDHRKIQP